MFLTSCIIILILYDVHLEMLSYSSFNDDGEIMHCNDQQAKQSHAQPSLEDRLLTTLRCEELSSLWISGYARPVPSCHQATESSSTLFFRSLYVVNDSLTC